ncbi:glycosyltransferase [Halosimplex aquaticum]
MRFRVVGDGDDETVEQLQARARELGVADRVEWVGLVPHDEVPRMLGETDVAVSPSATSSRSGSASPETPGVHGRRDGRRRDRPPGPPAAADPRRERLLYDGTTEELVATLDACVEGDVDTRALARNARSTAEDYDWDVITARHERVLFDRLVEQRRAAPVSA